MGDSLRFVALSRVFPKTPNDCPCCGISEELANIYNMSPSTEDAEQMFYSLTALYSHLVATYIYHNLCQPDAIKTCIKLDLDAFCLVHHSVAP